VLSIKNTLAFFAPDTYFSGDTGLYDEVLSDRRPNGEAKLVSSGQSTNTEAPIVSWNTNWHISSTFKTY